MASTKVGIVYNRTTGIIFSIVWPTDDSELVLHPSPTQNMLTPTLAQYNASTATNRQNACYMAAGLTGLVSPTGDLLNPVVQAMALLVLLT